MSACHAASRAGDVTRAGTVLIIVAGVSALLASMALAYLVNMRSDMEESALVIREAQARLVLIAGLQYIQEASRLGWDRPGTVEHEEAFGWADVRDGSAGPKDSKGVPLYAVGNGMFPDIGGKAARFPLFVMERPPYAIRTSFAYNPAPMTPSLAWKDLVNYANPDPQPAALNWEDFEKGRQQARTESLGLSWFRVYRDRNAVGSQVEPATFTITCGAGQTQGFRSYQDAVDAGKSDVFLNDPQYFAMLRAQERLLWFRAEWTSAVGGSGMGVRVQNGYWELPEINQGAYPDVYRGTPLAGADQHWWVNRNPLGSFRWIQRLEGEPAEW
jgi:hypothetical protein